MDRCDECGFVYDLTEAPASGPAIIDGARELAQLLRPGTAPIRTRQHPQTWSPLEYCCHVRDVLLVQRERVLLARRQDGRAFEPMGRDERVEHDGYAEQPAGAVARQLTDAARMFANVLSRLNADDWERTVIYNYPTPTERSLRWVAAHTLHEVRHHLLDVRRQLPQYLTTKGHVMKNSESVPAGVRGSELEALHALVGTWASEGETVPGPAEPSIGIKGSDRYEWFGSGFIVHWVDVMMGEDHVEVIELIGEYDASSRSYAMRSFDGQGETALMRASVDHDGVWTFAGQNARATLTIADDGKTMAARWERSDDGSSWRHWMDMRFTKQ